MRLKLGLVGDDAGHNFTFTSPQPVALVEREKFKAELTNIISRNRSGVSTPTLHVPGTPTVPTSINAASSKIPVTAARTPHSRAASVAGDGRASATPVSDPTSEFRLRKKVLLGNPELAALHRELVMGGHITENEFWEGREVVAFYCTWCHLLTHVVTAFNPRASCCGEPETWQAWSARGPSPSNRGRGSENCHHSSIGS